MVNRQTILVYQMGKVGSDSLSHSIGNEVLHLHSLYGSGPTEIRGCRKKIHHRLLSKYKYFKIRRKINSSDLIKIITIIRDPFERDVSMFFQDLYKYIYYYSLVDKDYYLSLNSGGIEKLNDVFLEMYDINYGLDWFDNEIRRFSGIDIFNDVPEVDRGSTEIFKNGRYELFLCSLQGLNECLGEVEDFLGFPISYRGSNRSSEKWYSSVYRSYLSIHKLPIEYTEKIKGSKLYEKYRKLENKV